MDTRIKNFIEAVLESKYPKNIKTELIAAIACFDNSVVSYEFDDDEARDIFEIAISLWV